MKTLREYLERNNYSIVKSLAEMLSISPEEATDFYKSISTFDEGKVVSALKDGADDDDKSFVTDLYNDYQKNQVGESITSPEDLENAQNLKDGQDELRGFGNQPEDDQDDGDDDLDEADAELDPNFDNVNDRFEIGHNGKEYTITDHKTGEIVDTAWSGHEAHNLLTYWRAQGKKTVDEASKVDKSKLSQMAGKAKAGGYDPARELSKGQYQPKVVADKKKKFDRMGDKSKLKRGMFENTVVPVLVSSEDGYKFKIVESSLIAGMKNVEALFESAIVTSPIGGLTAIPGVGMNGLRKMSGISPVEAVAQADEITEIESPDLNSVLAIIDYMDEMSKACLINMLTNTEVQPEPAIDAEQLAMVKTALCDFGSALQSWIECSDGGLDFLCPLVDTLWVKYNEI